MKNTLCEFLTFAGGAKSECKHSSLAYAFRAKKENLKNQVLRKYYVCFYTSVESSTVTVSPGASSKVNSSAEAST